MGRPHVTVYADDAPGVNLGTGVNSIPANYPSISLSAGNMVTVKVKAPSDGKVLRCYVKQRSGTNVAFTVELMMSVAPYPVGQQAYNTAAAVSTPGVYRIFDPLSATAGNAAEATPNDEFGWVYRNVDSDYTMNQRLIYLSIIPGTSPAGACKFDASLVIEEMKP